MDSNCVLLRFPLQFRDDLLLTILTFDFPSPPQKKNFCWRVQVVGQWPSVREAWRIFHLMELESNNIIANWCPDTALWCCLTTLSQHSGESTSMYWRCTIRQTTQCNIRMSLCSYFWALFDFVQWKCLLSSPTDAQQLPRELFLSPSYSTSWQS